MEVDLSNLDAGTRAKVDEIFRTDFDLKVMKAVERQTAIAKRNHLHRPRAQDGYGERTLEVDAVIDGLWRQFYGHDYSEDKDLLRFLVKRNPEIAVRSLGTRVQTGYSAAGRGSKFFRRYKAPGGAATGENGSGIFTGGNRGNREGKGEDGKDQSLVTSSPTGEKGRGIDQSLLTSSPTREVGTAA